MKPRKASVVSAQACPTLGNCLECPHFCGIILVFDEFRVLCGSDGTKQKIIAAACDSISNNTKKHIIMTNEDYSRLVRRMNEVQPSDKAALLVTMDCIGDVTISTMGEPQQVEEMKRCVLRTLQGEGGRK